MKFSTKQFAASPLALLLLNAHVASAHYQFPILVVNNTMSEWWQYVRPTGLDKDGYHFSPNKEFFTEPQVCGHNATKTGHDGVKTAVVEAGSKIGFQAVETKRYPGLEEPHPPVTDHIQHPGPGQLYLSKAPGALEDYEGDGDWFKIGSIGSSSGKSPWWDSYLQPMMNFTIPATTPPGKYLARVEHLYSFSRLNYTQQFINCAHIEVVGPGGGTPGPMTKFPGAYKRDEPGVQLPENLTVEFMKNFPFAGPAIWRG